MFIILEIGAKIGVAPGGIDYGLITIWLWAVTIRMQWYEKTAEMDEVIADGWSILAANLPFLLKLLSSVRGDLLFLNCL